MEKQEPRGNENDAFETQKMQNNVAEQCWRTCERCKLTTKNERKRERLNAQQNKMEIVMDLWEKENQTKMQMNIKLFALNFFCFVFRAYFIANQANALPSFHVYLIFTFEFYPSHFSLEHFSVPLFVCWTLLQMVLLMLLLR